MHPAPHFPIGTLVDLGGERRRWFSYQDIENIALHHRREVMACRYDAIVGLARGGLYLATMLSQMTGIAHGTAYYDRAAGTVRLHNLPPHRTARLLLVEDVAGKGHTLERVRHALQERGAHVDLMVVCWDDLSRHVPDYYGAKLQAGERYLFAWERSQLAPTSPDRTGHDDLACWLTAFDLDGVFLEDVPAALYTSDLQAALAARDRLPALAPHPDWRSGDLIVSGRLEKDRDRTEAWLARHGLAPSRLLLRPSLDIPAAEFKRRALVELGITEYIESELAQAEHIAGLPHVVVWHYDCHARRNRRICTPA
ncbi:phosphoribosyltransferase family protein [Bordetella sp. FB-8]|uniref:phosphoribosyltransferase family protein n=1 Tax=Bordetella sp. FB-8 TaxID=1159870 RepID=UPI0003625D45|nr:phosphoribosyltransferase family protein [Bordetella sp. FB-8]